MVSNTLREAAKQQIDLTAGPSEVVVKAEPYLDEDRTRHEQMLREEQAHAAAEAKQQESSTKKKQQ